MCTCKSMLLHSRCVLNKTFLIFPCCKKVKSTHYDSAVIMHFLKKKIVVIIIHFPILRKNCPSPTSLQSWFAQVILRAKSSYVANISIWLEAYVSSSIFLCNHYLCFMILCYKNYSVIIKTQESPVSLKNYLGKIERVSKTWKER